MTTLTEEAVQVVHILRVRCDRATRADVVKLRSGTLVGGFVHPFAVSPANSSTSLSLSPAFYRPFSLSLSLSFSLAVLAECVSRPTSSHVDRSAHILLTLTGIQLLFLSRLSCALALLALTPLFVCLCLVGQIGQIMLHQTTVDPQATDYMQFSAVCQHPHSRQR
ncbi:unnamed protein product [Protopolystoma xenopodis]|uniref:Uncharacterized protein n=1 Tax=Protopolystoma xenopodis TaxID=117903 RepID=A0A3S5CPM9_9PLAT|nr:unnamed protein product [Protopolystoma xenopodis]